MVKKKTTKEEHYCAVSTVSLLESISLLFYTKIVLHLIVRQKVNLIVSFLSSIESFRIDCCYISGNSLLSKVF